MVSAHRPLCVVSFHAPRQDDGHEAKAQQEARPTWLSNKTHCEPSSFARNARNTAPLGQASSVQSKLEEGTKRCFTFVFEVSTLKPYSRSKRSKVIRIGGRYFWRFRINQYIYSESDASLQELGIQHGGGLIGDRATARRLDTLAPPPGVSNGVGAACFGCHHLRSLKQAITLDPSVQDSRRKSETTSLDPQTSTSTDAVNALRSELPVVGPESTAPRQQISNL